MVTVRHANEDDVEKWNDLVRRSPQGTPFHHSSAVEVFAEHSGAESYPLIGYKGQEPVGMFPVYELSRGPLTAAFSPPPDLEVVYQGPVLVNFSKLKRRKAQMRHRRFLDGCVEWIDAELAPNYVHVRTATGYDDARTLAWNDFEITPRYTYVVDITPESEDLLGRFSSDARRNVRNGHGDRCDISEGDEDAVERIVAQVSDRHEYQGESYSVTSEFVTDLRERLPEGTVRPYVCTVDGSFAGGMITIESDDTVYRWQGGAKPDVDVPVNDLLDWHIMRDAKGRGVSRYDMVGANDHRISKYKAKFAPDLETYHETRRGDLAGNVAVGLYTRLR
jgi:hypothetical protein